MFPRSTIRFGRLLSNGSCTFFSSLVLVACSKLGPFITSAAYTIIGYAALILLHGTSYNNFPVHFFGLFVIGTAGALGGSSRGG